MDKKISNFASERVSKPKIFYQPNAKKKWEIWRYQSYFFYPYLLILVQVQVNFNVKKSDTL